MRHFPASLALPLALAAVSLNGNPAIAQTSPAPLKQSSANVTPKLDIVLGYNHIQANAPPGVSNDFSMNGAFAGVDYHLKPWLALTAEATGGHANNISNLGQNLTLTTFAAGPRLQLHLHRFVPFGQALFGAAHGSDSYFPTGSSYTTSATSFAYTVGGGLDINITHRIAIRPIEAQFLHTSLPNGTTNIQRHLLTGAGIVIKFGGRIEAVPPPPPPAEAVRTKPSGDIHFSCSLDLLQLAPGAPLQILGETSTEPDHLNVMYTWMPDAGMIEGAGRDVVLNTTGLAPGHHVIHGHAAVTGDYTLAADCELHFTIVPTPVPPPPPPPLPPAAAEKEFHDNVPDAYFDYNNAILRPDAQQAAHHAAEYLNAHPKIQVRVEGFADERGSVEYNLMLGQLRAAAARNALLAAGVESSRVEIVSYGKAQPVCTVSNESCYHQNRRAAFSLHP